MASKIAKTRARLEKRIKEGAYYEAHQQLRVLCQRYVKQENYSAAIDIAFSGAQALLKAGQHGSGTDLCMMLVDLFKQSNTKPTAESKGRILLLLSLISSEEPSRRRFINEAIVWSAKHGEYATGDPELHHYIGSLLADEDEMYEAEKHLLVGTKASVEILARLLYRWYSENEPFTAPQFAARVVLPYLLLRNIRDAARAFEIFVRELIANNSNLTVQEVQSSTSEARVFPSLPLLNFLGLLIQGCQRGSPELFNNLKTHYAGHLSDVAHWDEPLDQIGDIYFGIKIRRPASLLDMMGSLFGGPMGGGQSNQQQITSEPPSVDLD